MRLRRWRQNSIYIAVPTLLALLLPMWARSLQGIMTIIGLFGAGVLIVFKEVILNIAGWLYLVLRRPFDTGNRIIIDGHIGDVFEIRLLDFSMIEVQDRQNGGQSTGRVIHVPNSMLLVKPVANSSKQFAFNWNEITIPLTLQSNWQLAEQIILEVANQVAEEISRNDNRISFSASEYAIRYSALTPVVYVEYRDEQILLILRHLTEPRKTRILTDQIWRAILIRFKKHRSIQLAGRD